MSFDTLLTPGTYAEVRRTWSTGDIVVLNLPMRARLVASHPTVEANRNQVAVTRGPIVYCLESIDLPADVTLSEIAIPLDTTFTPWYDVDLLGGIVALEADVRRRAQLGGDGDLYRPIGPGEGESIHIQLIPYYAWNNRGTTEMSVWLPLA